MASTLCVVSCFFQLKVIWQRRPWWFNIVNKGHRNCSLFLSWVAKLYMFICRLFNNNVSSVMFWSVKWSEKLLMYCGLKMMEEAVLAILKYYPDVCLEWLRKTGHPPYKEVISSIHNPRNGRFSYEIRKEEPRAAVVQIWGVELIS